MKQENSFKNPMMSFDWMNDAYEYWLDASQRSILFMDTLRKRGDNYFATVRKGEPPVLIFDYKIILKGKTLDRPVNYDLAAILPRKTDTIDPKNRPIVVIDPRAGNGPGIGGSKRDSEIGDALAQGHPVYFILFHPEPVPNQTLSDVEKAEIRFIEEVERLHPQARKPAVIGNCQAGWAVALLGADRPDLTGPLVLNGSPLSYWSGVQGKNPMRYAGGLLGGIWLSSLLSDLGNGKFDGAWLEENFESLNPGNTLWTKQYNLYANVDTDEEKYLTFEKWWDGYSEMTKEEMHSIVQNLFVGDKLETGKMSLDRNKILNLKDIKKPLLLFASEGDNITPPQEALDWIIKDYSSVAEIKSLNKVIIYLISPDVGHLGIFVGSKTAKKEHNEIIQSIEVINALSPGLYEMIIVDKGKKEAMSDYDVRFEERDFQDIRALNENKEKMKEDAADFSRVAAVSEMNDRLYNTFLSPWVKMFSTTASAEIMKQIHPLRVNKYIFSDKINPLMLIFKDLASVVKKNRRPVPPGNRFLSLEKKVSDNIVAILDGYQKYRDHFSETLFFSIYENPWMKLLFPATAQKKKTSKEEDDEKKKEDVQIQKDRQHGLRTMEKGGYEEGIIRMVIALEDSDRPFDRDALYRAERLLTSSAGFKKLNKKDFMHIAHEQYCIIQADEDKAFKSLAKLITTPQDRKTALTLAKKIVSAGTPISNNQRKILSRINNILQS